MVLLQGYQPEGFFTVDCLSLWPLVNEGCLFRMGAFRLATR
jgi:hypothetical protein